MDGIDVDLERLVAQLSLEEKVRLGTGHDSWSTSPTPAIGLGPVYFSDGPAGVRGTLWDEREPSICFPSPTSVGASWDRGVVLAVGRGLGRGKVPWVAGQPDRGDA